MQHIIAQVKTILDDMDWEQAEQKGCINLENALIPYDNPEMEVDLDLGQLFIFINNLDNDIFSISLTAQEILDETEKALQFGYNNKPYVEFTKKEKKLIIDKYLEILERLI